MVSCSCGCYPDCAGAGWRWRGRAGSQSEYSALVRPELGTQSWPRTADTQLSFPAVTRLSNTHSMSLHNKIHTGENKLNLSLRLFYCWII